MIGPDDLRLRGIILHSRHETLITAEDFRMREDTLHPDSRTLQKEEVQTHRPVFRTHRKLQDRTHHGHSNTDMRRRHREELLNPTINPDFGREGLSDLEVTSATSAA